MVLNKIKRFFLLALLTLNITGLWALEVPALKGRVNDYANIINQNTEEEIVNYLKSLEDSTGIQMVVLTIPSLQGDDITSFSIKAAEKWQIGRKDKDDGALLLVALQERLVRIEVGYGLEGKLTDAKCGLIIRNVIIPEFKDGDYSSGIEKGIKNMVGIASDNAELITDSVEEDKDESSEVAYGILSMIIWLIFLFIIIISRSGRRSFFGPLFFIGGSNYRRSNNSSFGSGFGSGSSFGGGFHGGGGHFGGGGASGHW
ncbi:MAG: TPM domain-containing protein [Treponema sp.]|nr:TPM domain-containing protein [Treponema sp.]